MKFLICIIILFFSFKLFARDYHVSGAGNDSYTSFQAQNPATPWQTINKINSFTFASGDRILFEKGYTYYGTIIVGGDNLSFSSFGSNSTLNPIISGFTSISNTGWTDLGNGIWQKNIPSNINKLNVVTYQNLPKEMGRYPNPTEPNSGYLTYESFNGNTSITDNQSPFTSAWDGAEVCIRKQDYTLERHFSATVTNNNTTINYIGAPNINLYDANYFSAKNGYGYFLQNSILALDRFGEWAYNSTTKNLAIYFGVGSNPNSYSNFSVSTTDVLINIGTKNNITISNIKFEGANLSAIYLVDKQGNVYFKHHDITVTGCQFINIGARAIHLIATDNVLIDNCRFDWCLSNAIQSFASTSGLVGSNCTIRNCKFYRIAPFVGMASFVDNADNNAIHAAVNTNLIVENNQLQYIGKAGILWQGSDVVIRNNWIENAVSSFIDYGAIYTYVTNASATPMIKLYGPQPNAVTSGNYTNRVINNNIIRNCSGQANGTIYASSGASAVGIYLDGETMNVDVLRNTVTNVAKNGISCNNPVNVNVRENNLYNNGKNAISIGRWYSNSVSDLNINVTGNVCFSSDPNHHNIFYSNNAINLTATSVNQDLASIGIINDNFYGIANSVPFDLDIYSYNTSTKVSTSIPTSEMSLATWRSISTQDLKSMAINLNKPYGSYNLVGSNRYPNGEFNTNINGINNVSSGTAIISTTHSSTPIVGPGSLKIDISNSTPSAKKYPYINSQLLGVIGSDIEPVYPDGYKGYVLRFTTRGSTNNGIVKFYLRKRSSPYNSLTGEQKDWFGTSDLVHEAIFQMPPPASSDGDVSFVIQIENNSGTTYIDNIQFYETDVVIIPSLGSRLFYNPFDYPIDVSTYGYTCGYQSYSSSFTNNPMSFSTSSFITLSAHSSFIAFNASVECPSQCVNCPRKPITPIKQETYVANSNQKIICFPNPANSTLTIDKLSLEDIWESLNISSTTGRQIIISKNIKNQKKVSIDISKLSQGVYIVILKRKKNTPFILKFIKF